MATSTSAGQHVPAWKRLGLKLKFAKDTPAELSTPSAVQGTSEQTTARKRPREAENAFVSSKKQKSDAQNENENEKSDDVTGHEISLDAASTPGAVISRKRSKSVTFTSDTKIDDGFSATTLYQDWLANENELLSIAPTQVQEAPHVPEESVSRPPAQEKRPKKEKAKSKTDKAAKAARAEKQSDSQQTPDFVQYLVQFHTDKSTWKFHKKKQNELIKHCFDLSRIPSTESPALVAYIRGLQGVGVQQRLLESAEKILQDLLEREGRSGEIADMESAEARKAVYEAAVQRQIDRVESLAGVRSEYESEKLEELARAAQESQRADAILKELLLKGIGRPPPIAVPRPVTAPSREVTDGVQTTPYQDMISRAAPKRTTFADEDEEAPTNTPHKRKNGRKSRTTVAENASSSSSSSSSDDSDSSDSSSDDDAR